MGKACFHGCTHKPFCSSVAEEPWAAGTPPWGASNTTCHVASFLRQQMSGSCCSGLQLRQATCTTYLMYSLQFCRYVWMIFFLFCFCLILLWTLVQPVEFSCKMPHTVKLCIQVGQGQNQISHALKSFAHFPRWFGKMLSLSSLLASNCILSNNWVSTKRLCWTIRLKKLKN